MVVNFEKKKKKWDDKVVLGVARVHLVWRSSPLSRPPGRGEKKPQEKTKQKWASWWER